MKKLALTITGLLCLILMSCENEPIGEENINYDTFEVDSELYLLLERTPGETAQDPLECIDFNYSLVIFVFNENTEYVEPVAIDDNEQFIDLLNNLPTDFSISISYPIKGTQANGELLTITNNDELKAALEACEKEEEIRNCNGSFRTCYWKIDEWDGYPNDYEGEYIAVNDNDILQLHSDRGIYFGSWVTFHIGDELHMNISFIKEEETAIGAYWNQDWKVISLSDALIELEYDGQRLRIVQDCDWDCTTQIYQKCELEEDPGFALFDLQDYSLCTFIPPFHDRSSSLKLSYFENEEDATNDENALDPNEYTNSSNPQTIFIRIETIEEAALLGIESFDIEAVPCNPLATYKNM
ncbi:MAG: hypothetical protein KTR22_09930 [Flavobacteriaceae bacterium]|nr:hypothetical protein [Flavobacteriaceae bacterium]